ncbi:MAG: hypothetical protein IRZ08_07975, partial [Frankia sp.]|nr:hypothetical protein [Frankia sp.]
MPARPAVPQPAPGCAGGPGQPVGAADQARSAYDLTTVIADPGGPAAGQHEPAALAATASVGTAEPHEASPAAGGPATPPVEPGGQDGPALIADGPGSDGSGSGGPGAGGPGADGLGSDGLGADGGPAALARHPAGAVPIPVTAGGVAGVLALAGVSGMPGAAHPTH